MGLDEELRIMKRTVDIYKPYSPMIEVGDKAERITDISVRTAHLIEYELPQQKLDKLAFAKTTATDLINAAQKFLTLRFHGISAKMDFRPIPNL